MCDCIKQHNENLKSSGLRLKTIFYLLREPQERKIAICMENIKTGKTEHPIMTPIYCPFCGQKHDSSENYQFHLIGDNRYGSFHTEEKLRESFEASKEYAEWMMIFQVTSYGNLYKIDEWKKPQSEVNKYHLIGDGCYGSYPTEERLRQAFEGQKEDSEWIDLYVTMPNGELHKFEDWDSPDYESYI